MTIPQNNRFSSPVNRGWSQPRGHSRTWQWWALGLSLCGSMAFADELPVSSMFALDTMAPDSRWAVRLEQRSNDYDARYDSQGKRVGLGNDFNGVALNSSIFPSLALLGANASLGTTRFASSTSNQISTLTLGYGLTADITLGAIVPYVVTHTRASFDVSGGNVGMNPAFDASQPIGAGNFPFAPAGGGIPAMTAAGVQNILTNPAFGYGYKALGSQRSEGLSDPTLGVLWRAIKSADRRLIVGLGVRPGIASKDDPDDLLDTPAGDGSTDIRSRLEYFQNLGQMLDLRLLADYNWQTADKASMRIPEAGQLLALASSKQRLQRDLGDFYEADIELGFRPISWGWPNWRYAATLHRYEKQADRYQSARGTDTSSLEQHTHVIANQYRLSASWSGLQAWQQGKLPLPLIVKLEMQDTFSGKNFVDVRDLYLQVTTLF